MATGKASVIISCVSGTNQYLCACTELILPRGTFQGPLQGTQKNVSLW